MNRFFISPGCDSSLKPESSTGCAGVPMTFTTGYSPVAGLQAPARNSPEMALGAGSGRRLHRPSAAPPESAPETAPTATTAPRHVSALHDELPRTQLQRLQRIQVLKQSSARRRNRRQLAPDKSVACVPVQLLPHATHAGRETRLQPRHHPRRVFGQLE